MSEHTPGPWTAGLLGEYGTNNANIIYSGGENSIATVYGVPMHTKLEEVEPRWSEGIANARLIAAAPDMLEALQRLTRPIPDDEGMGYALDDIRNGLEVIAKATGNAA